jgi:hypothetical protein
MQSWHQRFTHGTGRGDNASVCGQIAVQRQTQTRLGQHFGGIAIAGISSHSCDSARFLRRPAPRHSCETSLFPAGFLWGLLPADRRFSNQLREVPELGQCKDARPTPAATPAKPQRIFHHHENGHTKNCVRNRPAPAPNAARPLDQSWACSWPTGRSVDHDRKES